MKSKLKSGLFVAVVAMMTAGVFISACADKNENENITTCNFNNPLTDLPWLQEMVERLENTSPHHVRIYQCTYQNNKIGFVIEPCVGCPDAGYSFLSCKGTVLCGGGGITGIDNCNNLNIEWENEILIYELNNEE